MSALRRTAAEFIYKGRKKNMSRPLKKGIDYFPCNVDILDDEKLFDVQNDFGPLADSVYIRLLGIIYANGYYYEFSDNLERLAGMLVKLIGAKWVTKNRVRQVILCLVQNNLFSPELYERGVITSAGVQKRYLKIAERRKPDIKKHWIIGDGENQNVCSDDSLINAPENRVFADNNPINAYNNTVNADNNPLNKSKVNKIKINESKSKVKQPAADDPSTTCTVTVTLTAPKEKINFTAAQITELEQLYPDVDIVKDIEKIQKDIDGMPKCNLHGESLYDYIQRWFARTQTAGGNKNRKTSGKNTSFDVDEFFMKAVKKGMKIQN